MTEIPISVPPFHGLEPRLSLAYNSNSGNGWIGAGWNLSGGPSYVERASKGRGAPRFDASDIFLLDGMELVPCTQQSISPSCTSAIAAFGSSNGFYSTKTENFQRIQYVSTTDSWYIWTKTGKQRVLQTQRTNPSGTTYRWALASETDTHGNRVSYSYLNDANNESYLGEISYNDTPSAPGAHIKFYSFGRPDVATFGVGFDLARRQLRLQGVDVIFGGSRVRLYALNYHPSGSTLSSLLDAVQVFAQDAVVNCGAAPRDPCEDGDPPGAVLSGTSLPPMKFQYEETPAGTFQKRSGGAGGKFTGDFNGDGKVDYLDTGQMSFDAPSTINTYLSNGDGTFTVNSKTPVPDWCADDVDTSPSADACFVSQTYDANGNLQQQVFPVVVGDFNGDGKTDFLIARDSFEVFLSNGDGTFRVVPSAPPAYCHGAAYQCFPLPMGPPRKGFVLTPLYPHNAPRVLVSGEIISGDFNGDGKTDFMTECLIGRQVEFCSYLSNGDGTFNPVPPQQPPLGSCRAGYTGCLNTEPNHIIIGDFDGDGKADFLSANDKFEIFRSNGDGTFNWISKSPPQTANCTLNSQTKAEYCLSSAPNAVIVGDFNGDGKTDFASAGTNNVFLSNGDGSFTPVSGAILPPICYGNAPWQGCINPAANHVIAGDFNGDGKTGFISANANFDVWISLGDGNFQSRPSIAAPPECTNGPRKVGVDLSVGDFNGDGKTDFSCAGNIWMAGGGSADRLVKTSNGLGGTTAVSYAPSSKYPSTYLPEGAVFQTVATTTASDGHGVSDTHTYGYSGALWNDAERQFLGFGAAKEILDAAGNYTQTLYSQTPACFSQPLKSYLRDPLGNIFNFSAFSYFPQSPPPPAGGPPFSCLLQSRTDYQAERTCSDDTSCTQKALAMFREFSYDGYGNVSAIVEHGDSTGKGDRLTEVLNRPNLTAYIVGLPAVEYVYARQGNTQSLVKSTAYAYDAQNGEAPPARGDMTQRSGWHDQSGASFITSYSYDAHGNLTSVTDANNHTSRIEFDPTYSLYPIRTCNALAQCSTSDWDLALGQLKSLTDANGATTQFAYDVLGRSIQVRSADGGQTQRNYEFISDASGAVTGQKLHEITSDGSTDGLWTDTYSDGLGRIYMRLGKSGCEVDTQYSDATPNPLQVSNCHAAGIAPLWTQFKYDGAQRLTDTILPDGTDFRTTFGVGSVTKYDGLGHDKTFFADAFGHTVRVQEHNGGKYATTSYIYDALDRIIQVQDAAGNYALTTWDSLGRRLSTSDPDMGTCRYAYDPVGNLLSQTDAKGQTIQFTYDALNRVLSKTYPDGAKAVRSYDELNHGASATRLTSIAESTAVGTAKGSDSFSYDSMGRATSSTKCRAGFCATINSSYDLVGRLSRLTYPDVSGAISSNSETVVYGYDAAGRLVSVAGSAPYVSSMTYDVDGTVSSINYGNGVSAQFSFDDKRRWLNSASVMGMAASSSPTRASRRQKHRPAKPGAASPQPALYSATYAHDLNGRIAAIASPTNALLNLNFAYDDLDRLIQVSRGQSQQFGYDDIGNMTYNSAVGAYAYPGAPACSPPAVCLTQPHAVVKAGTNTYEYDANGNLTQGAGRTITWSYDNLPLNVTTSAGTTSFDYDARNQRVSKQEPGDPSPTYYFSPLVEREPSGALVYSYYAGPLLVARRSAGKVSWYHQDHLASVRFMTDAQAKIIHRSDYAAFGTTLVPASDPPDPYGFIGQLRDPSTSVAGADVAGLIYMNARYYDGTLGRFISADSIVPNPMNPQSLNRYSYALNDPVSLADPSGQLPIIGGCAWMPCPGARVRQLVAEGDIVDANEWMLMAGPPHIGDAFMAANRLAAEQEFSDLMRSIAFGVALQMGMDQLSQEERLLEEKVMGDPEFQVTGVSPEFAEADFAPLSKPYPFNNLPIAKEEVMGDLPGGGNFTFVKEADGKTTLRVVYVRGSLSQDTGLIDISTLPPEQQVRMENMLMGARTAAEAQSALEAMGFFANLAGEKKAAEVIDKTSKYLPYSGAFLGALYSDMMMSLGTFRAWLHFVFQGPAWTVPDSW